MTLGESIKRVVQTHDGSGAIRIADKLRVQGLNYKNTYEMVHRLTGIPLAEWDALLYEGEWRLTANL